ncbi:hypothetical protein BB559_000484 [Furculomyces boomerangus]|uniref:Uncharacterized protein n=1 Tax=Furculomyces boomerangus TaxID=61424 RepID=A0A2T9Z513_9FUNG|nr:hypothetical protein BB559_004673 [Furculomyces boomerangus]PVU99687.1 hypothetical protein BB559_000484 [Furculomyces boomerangus]
MQEWPSQSKEELKKVIYPETTNPNNIYYQNITGIVKGSWRAKAVNETTRWWNGTLPTGYSRIPDNQEGELLIQIESIKTKTKNINLIEGFIKLYSNVTNEFFGLEGIHWSNNGTFILYGYREWHLGVAYRILESMPNNSTFDESKQILRNKYEKNFASIVLEESMSKGCEYHIIGQMNPLSNNITKEQLKELESELENPTGAKVIPPPPLEAKIMMFSTNCSTIVSTLQFDEHNSKKNLVTGMPIRIYERKIQNFAIVSALIALVQALVFVQQISYTPTSSVTFEFFI